jgi:hypothetical protein
LKINILMRSAPIALSVQICLVVLAADWSGACEVFSCLNDLHAGANKDPIVTFDTNESTLSLYELKTQNGILPVVIF